MNKSTLLKLSIFTLLSLSLVSCTTIKGEKGDKGEQGIQGETGPKGDKGDPGENGSDGEDGATWLSGTSKPTDTLGKLGDMYLNISNGNVYQKEESGWVLKMNIRGEDGEDGKDGHNGSNGSQGRPGDTAYSNTILPSSSGYILPSKGSALINEDIKFSFVPNVKDEANKEYKFSVLDSSGNEVSDLSLDEDPLTFETKMQKGGFVVSIKEITTSTVTNEADFTNALNNLSEGENYVYIDGNIDLTNSILPTPISTLSTKNKTKNKSNNKKDIIVRGKAGEQIDVTILAKGKNDTLKVPLINIEGTNVNSFKFNNINLVSVYDPSDDSIIDNYENRSADFIKCEGIDELIFNNVNYSVELKDKNNVNNKNGLIETNFIDFSGTSLSFNNFHQSKENSDWIRGFINKTTTNNIYLKEVEMNNSTIYSEVPFRLDCDFYNWDLEEANYLSSLKINNCSFFTPKEKEDNKTISPFIEISDYLNAAVPYTIDIDINNTSYSLVELDELTNKEGWKDVKRDSLFHFKKSVTYWPQKFEGYGAPDFIPRDAEGIIAYLKEIYQVSYNFMDINLNNFEVNNERINSIDGYEFPTLSLDTYLCENCKKHDYDYNLFKTNEDELNNLFNNEVKPLVGIYLSINANNCKELTDENIEDPSKNRYLHKIYDHYFYDTSLFPTVRIGNKEVDKSSLIK